MDPNQVLEVRTAMEEVYKKEKNLAAALVLKNGFNEVLKKLNEKPGIGESVKNMFS